MDTNESGLVPIHRVSDDRTKLICGCSTHVIGIYFNSKTSNLQAMVIELTITFPFVTALTHECQAPQLIGQTRHLVSEHCGSARRARRYGSVTSSPVIAQRIGVGWTSKCRQLGITGLPSMLSVSYFLLSFYLKNLQRLSKHSVSLLDPTAS